MDPLSTINKSFEDAFKTPKPGANREVEIFLRVQRETVNTKQPVQEYREKFTIEKKPPFYSIFKRFFFWLRRRIYKQEYQLGENVKSLTALISKTILVPDQRKAAITCLGYFQDLLRSITYQKWKSRHENIDTEPFAALKPLEEPIHQIQPQPHRAAVEKLVAQWKRCILETPGTREALLEQLVLFLQAIPLCQDNLPALQKYIPERLNAEFAKDVNPEKQPAKPEASMQPPPVPPAPPAPMPEPIGPTRPSQLTAKPQAQQKPVAQEAQKPPVRPPQVLRSEELPAPELARGLARRRALEEVAPTSPPVSQSLLTKAALSIDARQLGHIHGDAFVQETGLEGLPCGNALELMKQMARLYPDPPAALSPFLSEVEQTVDITKISSSSELKGILQLRLDSLKEGGSFLIAGGWSATEGGHALYYEITKEQESFSIRIYNTGDGLKYHAKLTENSQEKFLPFVDRTGVSRKSLLDTTFITGLWSLMHEKTVGKVPTDYSGTDVYECVFPTLGGQVQSDVTADDSQYIIPQQSGTCSWTGLMAVAKTKLEEKPFLHFRFFIGWQSISGFFKENEPSFLKNEQNRRLLLLCSEQFGRDCSEAFSKGAITEEEFKQGLATVQDVKDRLRSIERNAFLEAYRASPDFSVETRPEQTPPFGAATLPSVSDVNSAALAPPTRTAWEPWDFSQPWQAKTLTSQLQQFLKHCLALKGTNAPAALAEIYRLFDQLPIPGEADLWTQIPEADSLPCMEAITQLSELLLNLQPNDPSQFTSRTAAFEACKGMVIQFRLLQQHFPKIPRFSVNPYHFTSGLGAIVDTPDTAPRPFQNDPVFLGFVTPQRNKEIGQILSLPIFLYEKKVPALLFDSSGIPQIGSSNWETLIKSCNSAADDDFIKQCLENPNASNLPAPLALWYRQALVAAHLTRVASSSLELQKGSPFHFKAEKRPHEELRDVMEWHVTAQGTSDEPDRRAFASVRDDGLQQVIEYATLYPPEDGTYQESFLNPDPERDPWIASEELKSVAALFTREGKHLRLAKLLSLFSRRPHLLKKPAYQEFISIFLSEPLLLHNALNISEPLTNQLRAFIKRGAESALAERNIPMLCFFNRIAHQSLGSLQDLGKATAEDNRLTPPLNAILDACRTDDERAIVYREIASRIVQQQHPIADDSIQILIKARVFLSIHPVPEQYRSALDTEIEQGILSLACEIKRYTDQHPDRVKLLLNSFAVLSKQADVEWNVTDLSRWHRAETSIDIIKGLVVIDANVTTRLPLSITADPEFAAVFPPGEYQTLSSQNDTVYTFLDGTARVIILPEGGGVRVQRLINEKWYEFVPQDRVPPEYHKAASSPIGSLHLIETTSFWVAPDRSTILLLDRATKTPTYEIGLTQGNITSIMRVKDGCLLRNIYHDNKNPYNLLESIENRPYIYVWDKKDFQEIELPRYGIQLKIIRQRAYLNSPTGFYIAERQRLPGMGLFHNFLVIENEKGERKVLMPRREALFTGKEGTHPLSTQLPMDHSPTSKVEGAPSFLLYDIDAEGRCFTTRREETLYLAYLNLGQKNYAACMEHLRKYVNDISGYSAQEKELLQWIIRMAREGKDHNPQACAAHLCAIACLLKNSRQFGWQLEDIIPKEKQKPFLQLLNQKYLRYLQVIGAATTVTLSEDEEKELLRYLKPSDSQLQQRMAIINGQRDLPRSRETTSHITMHIEDQPLPPTYEILGRKRQSDWREKAPTVHWLRPRENLSSKFSTYYQKAYWQDTQMIKQLTLAQNDPLHGNLARILLCVAKEPVQFPMPSNINWQDMTEEYWRKAILQPAMQIFSQTYSAVSSEVVSIPHREERSMPVLSPLPTDAKPGKLSTQRYSYFFEEKKTAETPQASIPIGSPSEAHRKSFEALRADVAIAPLAKPPLFGLKKEKKPLTTSLQIEQAQLQKLLLTKEASLLTLANVLPLEGLEKAKRTMELASTTKTRVTIKDLTIFFIQQNPAVLLEKNPSLTQEDLDALNKGIMDYLVIYTQWQQVGRALSIATKLSDATPERQEVLLTEVGAELKRARSYDPALHPEYLVYEYSANLLIREDQVATLDKMGKEDAPECIYQMIMGSGKSKVLLPILALKKANGKNLSIIVVPEPLAETEAKDMQIAVGHAFYQSTSVIHIDRKSDFSAEAMKSLYEDLKRIKTKRGCLVMTSKTVGCLLLQFEAELKVYATRGGKVPENLEWMRKCLRLLRDKGDAIFDEADVLLGSRRELNFSVGSPEAIPEERLECVSTLFETCLELLPEGEVRADTATFATIKDRIARTAWEKIKSKHPVPLDDEAIIAYILGKADATVEGSVSQLDQKNRDLLGLLKGELETLLPLTLEKPCDTAYGFSLATHKPIAIPYDANNSPVESSDFGTPYEMLNYTMQAYLNKRPLPIQTIRPIIEELQEQLRKEQALYVATPISELPAYIKLHALVRETPFLPFDNGIYEKIVINLSNDKKLLLQFVREHVFTRVRIYPEKLTMTAPGLVDIFHHVHGFTGTPWNSDTFPTRLTVERAVGTDGKTLQILWNTSFKAIEPLKGEGFAQTKEEIVSLIQKKPNCRAFMDAGALFRGSDNETVARFLLSRLPTKAIVFYRGDTMMVLERDRPEAIRFEESTVAPDERFTYYDQRHTTGADILQAPQAHALLSIGKDLLLRDFAQGVWRMRGLDKEQSVSFVIPPSAMESIKKVCGKEVDNMTQLFEFLAENQFTMLDEHCLVAATQKADQTLKKKVLDSVLESELTPEGVEAIAPALGVFSTNTQDHPYDAFGGKETVLSGEEFKDRILTREKKKIQAAWPSSQDQQACEQVVKEVLEKSPTQERGIRFAETTTQTQVETEKEQEKEMQRELQIQAQQGEGLDIGHIQFETLDLKPGQPVIPADHVQSVQGRKLKLWSINSLLEDQQLPKVFDPSLIASSNFFHTHESDKTAALFSPKQFAAQYLLVAKSSSDETRARLLSFDEAQVFLAALHNGSKGDKPIFLYDMTIGVIQSAGNQREIDEMIRSDQFQRLKVQAKFFDGESIYTPEEIRYLQQWLEGKDKKEVLNLFVNTILRYKKDKQTQFHGSVLEKLLNT